MPQEVWYLKPWNDHHNFVTVQIDPGLIYGHRGKLGPALFFPYTLPDPTGSPAQLQLLSLEGWLGWGGEGNNTARIVVPSQALWPGQAILQVPIADEQIEAIEEARHGGIILLTLTLTGLAVLRQPSQLQAGRPGQISAESQPSWAGIVPVSNSPNSFNIERERWLTILQQLGAATRRLVELPEPRFPRQDLRWTECLRLLEGATQHYRSGAYEQAMITCRQMVEGVPQVLADAWGLPQKRANQSQDGWLQEMENRLRAAWPTDTITPGMLRTLLSGGWQWLAPAPHYSTGIPQREEVAFALGLCTDLLLFASQVLQAHPQPIGVSAP